jgi:hypothetical protein
MTNSRFEDLERRCLAMRRTRIAKVVFMCIVISLAGFFYFYNTLKPSLPLAILPKVPLVVVSGETVSTPIKQEEGNKTTQELNTSKEEVLLAEINESKSVENAKDESSTRYDTLLLSAKIVKNSHDKNTAPIEEKINLAPPTKELQKVTLPEIEDFLGKPEPKKPLSMSITSLSSEEALLKNFHSSKGFSEALALTHFYFEQKEYVKAISWAKESSKLKPVSDEPWILYAKSKFHLGDKAEAIRSLELFLGYVNSKEVKDLLLFYKGQR